MIVVHASELAACVGMHQYRPLADVVQNLFARMNPEAYVAAMARNALREKTNIENTLAQMSATTAVAEAVAADPDEMQRKLKDILESPDIAKDESLAADIQSFVYTERGKNAEESSLNRTEEQIEQKIQQRNARYYKKYIEYAPGSRLQIGGRVDGITEDGQLVEMKNRQRRLFSTVPLYEKIQVHAYMYLTDIHECRLVQCFKDKTSTTMVRFDEVFWTDITQRLTVLARRLDELAKDIGKQDELLVLQTFPVDFDTQEDNTPTSKDTGLPAQT